MRLYYAPGTISVAVAIALQEAGLAYSAQNVDFKSAAQTKPDYLAINPKGRVPALVLDDGTVLTETGAILDYVAAIAPDAGLVPADPVQAAKMRSVMYYLASTMHVNHAHKMRGARWADQQSSFDDMAAKVPPNMTQNAAFIEHEVLTGPCVMGETITIADAYLYVVALWLPGDKVDVAPLTKLSAFVHHMDNRDSIKTLREAGML